jgi:uncharacterized protein YegP (UPF0339 family)
MVAQYQIFKTSVDKNAGEGSKPQWYWRLVGKNGEIVCQSEGYTRRSSAIRAAKRMPEIAKTTAIAEVIE